MNRPKSICRQFGCGDLIDYSGYCEAHKREPFKLLDRKKTPQQKSFYSGLSWTNKSISFRMRNPLCKRCESRGLTVAVQMVHHKPDLSYLMSNGLNPYDDQYLEGLCNNCHLEDLRDKRKD